jgi:hypothetical protein
MACIHLQQLVKLCEKHEIKLSSSDLIRMTCSQCGEQEVCPSTLMDEYDARESRQLEQKNKLDKPRALDS